MGETNDALRGGKPPAERDSTGFLIVGLGGSAGAISAFREFFRNVPADSGMAYVVILHLSPEHESRLSEVLQDSAAIPVKQVKERVRVEPNQVFVIPPNKSLAMQDSMLELSEVKSFEERRAPIDIFFRTLADTHDSRAVGVVMSGSGSDGSMGLRRIKEYNGLTLVQDPREAEFAEMPRHSIDTGLVDFVAGAAQMPRRIMQYRDQLRAVHLPARDDEDEDRRTSSEQALIEIFTLLRVRTAHDFSNYKRATVMRRVERRMAVLDLGTLDDYARYLREHADEPQALLRELLISVTNFFRDREVWDVFAQKIIPKLLEGKRPEDHLRMWVAGCATGEEAYSIAMLLAEQPALPDVQIFATDLDEHAIARARAAFYSEADIADVSPERLRRFFVREQEGYRVRREVREMVLFAHHNLIKDPPFSHLDFISCRNLLIYLNRTAQQRALEILHFALEPEGFLLLGTAESVDATANLFSVVDKEAHIHQSRAVPRIVNAPQPIPGPIGDLRVSLASPPEPRSFDGRPRERFSPIDLHQRLLEQYAPPSLILDEDYNILHMSDRVGRYLQFAGGEASTNVMQVIRPELRIDLRSALFQSAQKRTMVAARGLAVHTGERAEKVTLTVKPVLSGDDPAKGFFLVLIEEVREKDFPVVTPATAVEPGSLQLEEELVRLKTQMRVTIEQYEVQAEEAKAANEELQAMNEELRSTAEELETSQEELQSVNEELQTVNQELKVKIDEIGHANDDLRNLMSSTEIGTIFVDRAIRVKLFTPSVREIFNLIPADVGRPLLDITNKLGLPDLAEHIGRVLDHLQTIEREVQTPTGRWYLMRLLPYRTSEDRIDGVVVTFIDVTARRAAEAALRESEASHRESLEERVRERTRQLETLSASRQKLLERLVTVTEDERRRIARDLHDEMGQHLTALRVGLQTLPHHPLLASLKETLSRIDAGIDRLSFELRHPALHQFGLRGAMLALRFGAPRHRGGRPVRRRRRERGLSRAAGVTDQCLEARRDEGRQRGRQTGGRWNPAGDRRRQGTRLRRRHARDGRCERQVRNRGHARAPGPRSRNAGDRVRARPGHVRLRAHPSRP